MSFARRRPLPARFYGRQKTPVQLVADEQQEVTAAGAWQAWLARTVSAREFITSLALLAVPAFILRALAVASFNPDVAAALVLNTAPVQLVYSSFVTLLPASTMLLAIYGARKIYMKSIGRGRRRLLAFLFSWTAVPLAVPFILVSPLDWASAIMLFVTIPLKASIDIHPTNPMGLHGHEKRIAGAFVAVYALLIVFVPTMWLPPERLEVASQVRTAYVLNKSDGDMVIFDPGRRTVIRIQASDVKGRQYCLSKRQAGRTVAQFFFGEPKGIPECP